MVDYIARTEHIADDCAEIMSIIAARLHTPLATPWIGRVNSHHGNETVLQRSCINPDVAKIHLLNETVVLSIASQYTMESALFGFLSNSGVSDWTEATSTRVD